MRRRRPCAGLLVILAFVGLGVATGSAQAQELPRLEYDSVRGVFILWYLDDQRDRRSVAIVPPNRVDPVARVTVDSGPPRQYRYVVANRATDRSTQPLWMFEVPCPPPDHVSIEAEPEGWSGDVIGDRRRSGRACRFMAPADGVELAPGESAGEFRLSSSRLPALVVARAWGLRPEAPTLEVTREIEPEEALLMGRALGTDGGWREFPMVGPAATLPPADPAEHLGALRADLREVCVLEWIAAPEVCGSLEARLTRALDALGDDDPSSVPGLLAGFLSELESERGAHVNEGAYWLLYLHVRDVLGSL